MNRLIQRKTTLQDIQFISKSVEDHNLKKKYGTSLEMFMRRNYDSELKEKVNVLRNQFHKIGKDKTSLISFEDVKDFFNSSKVSNQTYKFSVK